MSDDSKELTENSSLELRGGDFVFGSVDLTSEPKTLDLSEDPGEWYTIRIEMDPDPPWIFNIDGVETIQLPKGASPCNEPCPHKPRYKCGLKEGHKGDHHAPLAPERGYYHWPAFEVGGAPDLFREKCPGEKWTIWVHKQVRDFEQDSFGATAGFMLEGTPVRVLKRWGNILLESGPMAGQTVPMVKVRGLNENGRQITGWAMARDITPRGQGHV